MNTRSGFLTVLLLCAALASAQQYIYTNDNVSGQTNSTTALSVAHDGTVTVIATFSTGGASAGGSYFALSGVTSANTLTSHCLFVTNGGDGTIAAFTINLADGTLTTVTGSPFSGGPGGQSGNSLAVARNKFLYESNTANSRIYSFKIRADCSLEQGRSVATVGVADDLKVTPDGGLVIVPLTTGLVDSYGISYPSGLLSERGPFVSMGTPSGLDINCDGSTVYFGDAATNTQVEVYSIDSVGILREINNFMDSHGLNSNNVLLSPDGTKLYVSNTNSGQVTTLLTGPGGALTYSSTTTLNGASGGVVGLALGKNRPYIFVSEPNSIESVGVLEANGTTLSEVPGSPFPVINNGFDVGSLTTFPPRTCK